jgi:hypothetical protein
MNIVIFIGIGFFLLLWWLIVQFKKAAEQQNQHNQKKFKPQKDYLRNMKGGLK